MPWRLLCERMEHLKHYTITIIGFIEVHFRPGQRLDFKGLHLIVLRYEIIVEKNKFMGPGVASDMINIALWGRAEGYNLYGREGERAMCI